jgi:signal transduction histidine kinase
MDRSEFKFAPKVRIFLSYTETQLRSFQTLIRIRTICLVLMSFLLWISEDSRLSPVISTGWELLFINIGLSLVFGVLGKTKRLVQLLLPLVFIVDGIFVSFWIGISGGPVSFYVPFFLLVLVHAILVLQPRIAVVVVSILIAVFLGFFYLDYIWGLSNTFGANQINFVSNLLEHSSSEVRRSVYWHQSLRWLFFSVLMIIVCSIAMRQVWMREERLRIKERSLEQKRHLIQMGEMTGRVAHGVNTPLGLISGNLELLMAETRKSTKTYRRLIQINQYVQRAIRTVRDILDYGRQSMSQIRLVSFLKVVQAVAAAVQPKLKKNKSRLILDVDPKLPEIKGYPDGLYQALLNLVENAIDSISTNGIVTLTATFQYRSMRLSAGDKRGEIKVVVRDNGKGIPADKLPQIYEPFYSTKDFGKGTGLGLSIVKRIVDEHGGTIEVNSTVGVGTVFVLIFPVEGLKPNQAADSEDFYYNKGETNSKDMER